MKITLSAIIWEVRNSVRESVRIDVGASVRTSVYTDIQDDIWDTVRNDGWTIIDRFVGEFAREALVQI